jgi:Uncharacterized membrane protein (DUF2298)
MRLVFLALAAATVLMHVAAAGALCARWFPVPALARSAAGLGALLILFCVEHAIGLGRIGWLWPITSIAAAVYLARRWRAGPGVDWRGELPFALSFLGALAWRCCFPDIDGHSEQLSDLAIVAAYSTGQTLPPTDVWLPDLKLDTYYGLQHYAAALLGRCMGLSSGFAVNLAHAVLFGWSASLVWALGRVRGVPRALCVLPVLAVTVGGSGIAPLSHFIVDRHAATRADLARAAEDSLWTSVRFAGMFDAHVDTPLGRALFRVGAPDTGDDLPVENIAYLMFQGDYHAPLGGFVLLFVALLCIAWIDRSDDPAAPATGPPDPAARLAVHLLLGATVPVTLAVNTWVFPLQAVLVGGWCAAAWLGRRAIDGPAVAVGALAALVLLYPFLGPFTASGLRVSLGLVPMTQHTPVDRFVGLLWPAMLLCLLALLPGGAGRGRVVAVLILALLAMSEIVFVDDHSTGRYLRFNTVLKWWSWIYAGALAAAGTRALVRRGPVRWIAAAALLAVSSYAIDLAAILAFRDKPSFGRMDGDGWLVREPAHAHMLDWLKAAPRGIVVEGMDNGGGETYTPASAMALFSANPSASGWAHHESQWRADPWFIAHDADYVTRLYRGEAPDALRWLDAHRVRYIVWSRRDQDRDGAARARVDALVSQAFHWLPFMINGDEQIGLWVRK